MAREENFISLFLEEPPKMSARVEADFKLYHPSKAHPSLLMPAVCPKVLAGLRWERARSLEVEVPLAAAAEAVEGGDGDGVGAVPAATAPFETVDREFALGFGGAAADLPTLAAELGIENHLPTLRDVVQQLIGGLALFRRARKPSSPLHQVFPGGIISVALERMQNLAHPSFTFPRVCSIHGAAGLMHLFAEMVEVQAQAVEFGQMMLHLLANPRRAVDGADSLIGAPEAQAIRLAPQQMAGRPGVQVRDGHMLALHVLAVEVDHLEFLPRQVRPFPQGRQRTALAAGFLPLFLDLLPPQSLLGVGDDRHHHAVAAHVHAGLASLHAAVLGSPSRVERGCLLDRQHL